MALFLIGRMFTKFPFISKLLVFLVIVACCAFAVMFFENNPIYSTIRRRKLNEALDPADKGLIKEVFERFLVPPSGKPYDLQLYKKSYAAQKYNEWQYRELSYNFIIPELHKLYPQDVNMKGFFVEAGAYDGEMNSNTLYLETKRGWTGLLIEPDEHNMKSIISKNRKAWSCQCCLSAKPKAYETFLASITETSDFKLSRLFNSLVESRHSELRGSRGYTVYKNVQCIPLQTLLWALNRTQVDLVSLDVEDMEVDVLKAFPMSQITVDVWLVEHRSPSTGFMALDEEDKVFIEWFESNGYLTYKVSPYSPKDYIFIKRNSNFYEKNHLRLNLE